MNSNSSTPGYTVDPDIYSFRNQAYARHMRIIERKQRLKQNRKNNWKIFFKTIGVVSILSVVVFFFMFE